jgi:hypothetical protein
MIRSSLRQIGSGADGDDFATVVVTASVAQHVRTLEFTAVRAFVERFGLESIVAAAYPGGTGRSFFWDGHFGTCS